MPKIVDHDQYRKVLLSQCFDLFATKGYGSVTMRQIAHSLGVSTGTLYHYFPSKAALFEQMIEALSQEDILLATTEVERVTTLANRLEVLGQFLAQHEERLVQQICIWVDFCQYQDREELRRSQFFQRINQRYEQTIADLLGITDPELAWFILTSIDGILLERLWQNPQVSLVAQIKLLGQMLTAYLEQPPLLPSPPGNPHED